MKRCCKNVDITNRELIARATKDCLFGKITRSDTIRMLREYSGLSYDLLLDVAENHGYALNGLVETVVDGIQKEVIEKKYIVKPIRYVIKKLLV